MSPRIPDTHAEAWALLPWLANGRIQPSEREWVEAHVAGCDECRAELAAQRRVATQINRDVSSAEFAPTDEQRSFNKLWARIEASESVATPAKGNRTAQAAPRTSRIVRWLAAAVIVQGFGLALFGLNTLRNSSPDDIVTVTDVPAQRAGAPAVRIVFSPEASIATVNTLLTHQGLTLVSGPGTAGNFTAELSADAVASGASADSVAAVISRDPNVSFAQPVAR